MRSPVYSAESTIADHIGRTPLVRLQRMAPANSQILVKAEFLNPGGSVKSRTALGMLRHAKATGELNSTTTVIEATSGNEGIALAMLGAIEGFKVKIFMPRDVPRERQLIVEAYGGEVVLTPVGATIDETINQCLDAADDFAENNDCLYVRQFENAANPQIHADTTALELIEQLPVEPDAFVAAVGTGGTLMGVAKVLKEHFPRTQIVAVEPATAAPLSNGPIGNHGQVGIGEGFIPPLVDTNLIDQVITTTDEEAFTAARDLARTEGLLVGISSGTNIAATIKVANELRNSTVVTILPDSAERYFSSPLFKETEGGNLV